MRDCAALAFLLATLAVAHGHLQPNNVFLETEDQVQAHRAANALSRGTLLVRDGAKGQVFTYGGDGVAAENNLGAKGKKKGGKGSSPSFVLPLASPLNKPEVTYIPPSLFGNEKWDPIAGSVAGSGPHGDFRDAYIKPGQTVPFPPGTPPDMNPNMYIQPPPTGVEPSEIQIYEDAIVNHARLPRHVGPQGTLNGRPVYPRYISEDLLPPEERSNLPKSGLPFGPLKGAKPPPKAAAFLDEKASAHVSDTQKQHARVQQKASTSVRVEDLHPSGYHPFERRESETEMAQKAVEAAAHNPARAAAPDFGHTQHESDGAHAHSGKQDSPSPALSEEKSSVWPRVHAQYESSLIQLATVEDDAQCTHCQYHEYGYAVAHGGMQHPSYTVYPDGSVHYFFHS